MVNTGNVELPPNIRGNDGNWNMKRNNFIAPPIKGREMIDFEKIQAQDISGGIEVQFGDKTSENIFKVQVEDTTDVEWIDEYQRRLKAGDTAQDLINSPPLGRPQRQVSKMRNFGEQGQSVNDKIELLSAVVLQGNTETIYKEQMARILVATAQILDSEENLRSLTQENFQTLERIIDRMFIPKDWRANKFTHELYNVDQFRAQQGLINLYLLSNLPADRSLT